MIESTPIREIVLWLALCGVCVVFSGVYSAAETGMYCVSRLRLTVAAHRRQRPAITLSRLLEDRPSLLAATLFGTNVANYLAPVCLAVLLVRLNTPEHGAEESARRAEIYTTLILTPTIFIFGEVVPKNLFQRHADRFMLRVAGLLAVTRWFFEVTGLIGLQRAVSRFMLRRSAVAPAPAAVMGSRVEMYQLLQESAAEGNLSKLQLLMMEQVNRLRHVSVASVMVPLAKVQMLEAHARRADIGALLRGSRHARMPVYELDRRQVVGVIHFLDLADAPSEARVADLMRTIPRTTPDKTVLDVLTMLQRERRRIAAVMDAGDRCLGIVTVKDLVEEIVGELSAW